MEKLYQGIRDYSKIVSVPAFPGRVVLYRLPLALLRGDMNDERGEFALLAVQQHLEGNQRPDCQVGQVFLRFILMGLTSLEHLLNMITASRVEKNPFFFFF